MLYLSETETRYNSPRLEVRDGLAKGAVLVVQGSLLARSVAMVEATRRRWVKVEAGRQA